MGFERGCTRGILLDTRDLVWILLSCKILFLFSWGTNLYFSRGEVGGTVCRLGQDFVEPHNFFLPVWIDKQRRFWCALVIAHCHTGVINSIFSS